jgi:hypothetical protein
MLWERLNNMNAMIFYKYIQIHSLGYPEDPRGPMTEGIDYVT